MPARWPTSWGGEKERGRRGESDVTKITRHTDLEVYNKSFDVAMRIFELSKKFPKEETYSLTDQIRRASRSVCSNLAEGWRKRRYEAAFISKLSDSEGEAAETQVWLQFAAKCGYAERSDVAVPDSDVKKSLWCPRDCPLGYGRRSPAPGERTQSTTRPEFSIRHWLSNANRRAAGGGGGHGQSLGCPPA